MLPSDEHCDGGADQITVEEQSHLALGRGELGFEGREYGVDKADPHERDDAGEGDRTDRFGLIEKTGL